jgi:hypothetical protein
MFDGIFGTKTPSPFLALIVVIEGHICLPKIFPLLISPQHGVLEICLVVALIVDGQCCAAICVADRYGREYDCVLRLSTPQSK